MKRVLMIVCMLIPFTTNAGTSLLNAKAPAFSLLDQYEQPFTLQSFSGQAAVFVASDKEGSKQNREWVAKIQEKYGERVRIEGVADVRAAPSFAKSYVKSDFKKNKDSILLDWDGAFFKAYGLAKNVSNVILLDTKGFVRFYHAGNAAPDAVDRLFREIDGLIAVK